jgi:hypothetical protein
MIEKKITHTSSGMKVYKAINYTHIAKSKCEHRPDNPGKKLISWTLKDTRRTVRRIENRKFVLREALFTAQTYK